MSGLAPLMRATNFSMREAEPFLECQRSARDGKIDNEAGGRQKQKNRQRITDAVAHQGPACVNSTRPTIQANEILEHRDVHTDRRRDRPPEPTAGRCELPV